MDDFSFEVEDSTDNDGGMDAFLDSLKGTKTEKEKKEKPKKSDNNGKRRRRPPRVDFVQSLNLSDLLDNVPEAEVKTEQPVITTFRGPLESFEHNLMIYFDILTKDVSAAFISELNMRLEEVNDYRQMVSDFARSFRKELDAIVEDGYRLAGVSATPSVASVKREFKELVLPVTTQRAAVEEDPRTLKLDVDATASTFVDALSHASEQLQRLREPAEKGVGDDVVDQAKLAERMVACEAMQLMFDGKMTLIDRKMRRIEHKKELIREAMSSADVKDGSDDALDDLETLVNEMREQHTESLGRKLSMFMESARESEDSICMSSFELVSRMENIARCLGEVKRKKLVERENRMPNVGCKSKKFVEEVKSKLESVKRKRARGRQQPFSVSHFY